MTRCIYLLLIWCTSSVWCFAQEDGAIKLLKAGPLTEQGDFSALMVQGIDSFLTDKSRSVRITRMSEWASKGSEKAAWNRFISDKRKSLQSILGLSEARRSPVLEILTSPSLDQYVIKTEVGKVQPFRMAVFENLFVEGLLVTPKKQSVARIVLIPDADQVPESMAGIDGTASGVLHDTALRLAAQGVQVLIPVLVSREITFSGSDELKIHTNQPHREWLYRQGFDLGRHVIGYELQKIFSCIDWFETQNKVAGSSLPIGIAGYGEGGLLAMHAAALDERLTVALVSGYFGNSESVWQEPIYRNIRGMLKHAGNAELAAMVKGKLLLDYSESPVIKRAESSEGKRQVAAPGEIRTPDFKVFEREANHAKQYRTTIGEETHVFSDGKNPFNSPFSEIPFAALLGSLGRQKPVQIKISRPTIPTTWVDADKRQQRTVREMEQRMQKVLDECEADRVNSFWAKLKQNPNQDKEIKAGLRNEFYQVIGRVEEPLAAPAPRARLMESNSKWKKYEVRLDVWKGVFAWGILVVPNSVENGKPHPVVVCQHGLEGLPDDMITRDKTNKNYKVYKGIALDLAERGYITFSPHNPYRGEHLFRVLQRKANPIGLSLFSIIAGQHQQIINWLSSLPIVDSSKIGFYGLSYGGKTAMRIPALVEGYALSICSGDFNEWVRKVATTRGRFSYQFTKEYEIYEWDLGHTFNYAEMAALIAPRPFMVEYGYQDGIGTAEWIGYEFAKLKKHYDLSGLGDRVDIDLFNGIHEIHGVKTYQFLDKHLK